MNPLQALLGDRQHARLLRLSFPHDDGPQAQLLVNKIEADEGLSRDFEYTVELLSSDAGIALKQMRGKLLSAELVRADGSVRCFTGYVMCCARSAAPSDARHWPSRHESTQVAQ